MVEVEADEPPCSFRRDQRPDSLQPLLADTLHPVEVIHRPIGPPLDDAPGDHRPDPRQRLQLLLTRRVDVDPARRSRPVVGPYLRPGLPGWSSRRNGVADQSPPLTIA